MLGELWHEEPGSFTRVRHQYARPPAVGEHRHPPPSRGGLGGRDGSDVEELLEGFGPDYPCLVEQRFDGRFAGRQCRGV